MIAHLTISGKAYQANLRLPIPIGIKLDFEGQNPNCFYAPLPESSPVIAGDFVGDTQQGGLVNFKNIQINPHGNGTHTECVGHIASEVYHLPNCMRNYLCSARLVSIYPQMQSEGDRVITRAQLAEILRPGEVEAVVLRTLPNDDSKQHRQYSGANPPYLSPDAAQVLVDYGIDHLLLDLPSVDREEDGGALAAHRAFWQYPYATRTQATITEMVYLPNEIKDGLYLLQHQVTGLLLDASPSAPVLYLLSTTD